MIVSEEVQPLQPPGTIPSDAPPPKRSSSKATPNNAPHTIRIPSASVTTNAASTTKTNNHRQTTAAAADTITNNTAAASSNANSRIQQRSSASDCCYTLLALGVIVVVVIGLIVGIPVMISLVQRAKFPEFHVDAVSMTSPSNANASSYQTSPPSLSYWNMNVSFVAKNNYKTRMYYDIIRASLFYEKEFLSGTDVAPFYQEPHEQTSAQVTFGSWQPQVDKWVTTTIDGLLRSKRKAVKFNVNVQARVTTNPGSSSKDEDWMRIVCEDIKVVFLSNNVAGAMLTKAKKCKVRQGY